MKEVLNKCNNGDTVAFKNNIDDIWYTGVIDWLCEPNSKYNKSNHHTFKIDVILPIQPQWLNDCDTTVYYSEVVTSIILLEKKQATPHLSK